MRLRARHMHLIEGLVDNTIGLLMNYLAIILIYNVLLGHSISLSDNVIGGAIMFFIAWARKYTIRRWFNSWIDKVYKKRQAQEDAKKHIQERIGGF